MATGTGNTLSTRVDRTAGAGTLDVAPAVERLLREFLTGAGERIRALDPDVEPLVAAAHGAVLNGGKRLRPTFAYWGWRGAVPPEQPVAPVLPALAALELLHAYALAQDDVMDGAQVRRGQLTAHAALMKRHGAGELRGDAAAFGRSGAILVADLCMVWADQLLASAEVPSDVVARARHIYDGMRERAIAGQFLDVVGEASPVWPADRTLAAARLKTAYYTVVGPLRYGAALGRSVPGAATRPHGWDPAAGDGLDAVYTRYGLAVGEAFQLRDDLLDSYGNPALTGKQWGNHRCRGKPTMLLQLARTMADRRQRAALERELAGTVVDPSRLAEVVTETGATALVEWTITTRVADAVRTASEAPVSEPVKTALVRLAQFAMRRTA